MPSADFHFKGVTLLGIFLAVTSVFAAASVFAVEQPEAPELSTNSVVSTNSFLTNSAPPNRRDAKRFDERPREFGAFSPLGATAPKSFGGGQSVPGAGLFIPRPPVAIVPEKEDGKKDWIFAKPNDFSAEDAFKVKGFGAKDRDKGKEQSAFDKYVENKPDESSKSQRPSAAREQSRFGEKGEDARAGTKEENSKSESRASRDDPRKNDSLRDFSSRTLSDPGALENRATALNTKSSIFGEFFRGDNVAQERWAEQAAVRRNEFQQLFAKPSIDSGPSSVSSSVTPIPNDLNRSLPGGSDPWKNDQKLFSGPRSSFDEANPRALPTGPTGNTLANPGVTRTPYQPAVLPFPRRPGQLFK